VLIAAGTIPLLAFVVLFVLLERGEPAIPVPQRLPQSR
jgi:hypothetical protein